MIIVDSSVMIGFLGGERNEQTVWLGSHVDREPVGVTTLILTEVLQGIRSDRLFIETLKILEMFLIFEAGSFSLAVASARNHRILRSLGVTIRNTVDTFVATFCIEEGHSLLHRDSNFNHFERHLGLVVVDTSSTH